METMTAIEKRNEIARIALTIEDEELLNKVFRYTKNLLKTKKMPPCQYTLEEIIERADRQAIAYDAGALKTISHEDLLKKYTP